MYIQEYSIKVILNLQFMVSLKYSLKVLQKIFYNPDGHMVLDSAVRIATRYGLDGPGIESQWGWDFPHPSRPALDPIRPLIQWIMRLSWG
jgi:hypothetical protein